MNELLRKYFELLQTWNRSINLTAIDDEEGFANQHVNDSLALLPYLENAKTLLDLGTGAGIPGIILKIARPDLKIVLVDSTRKKISFCDEVIRKLGLTDIQAVWGRAEDVSMQRKLGVFDLVVSRATWDLSKFLDIAIPYMAPRGRCFAMKGKKWAEELEAAGRIERPSIALDATHPYQLRSGENRCIIIFKRSNSLLIMDKFRRSRQ